MLKSWIEKEGGKSGQRGVFSRSSRFRFGSKQTKLPTAKRLSRDKEREKVEEGRVVVEEEEEKKRGERRPPWNWRRRGMRKKNRRSSKWRKKEKRDEG